MRKKALAKSFSSSLRGVILLSFAFFLLLSQWSFAPKSPSHNFLGLLGYVIGWISFYLFGLCCFLIPLFLGWMGYYLMVKKEPSGFGKKAALFCTMLFSLCVLLSLFSLAIPSFSSLFKNKVLSGYFPTSAFYDPHCLRYYLGGVPFYRIYKDLSPYNLKTLMGSSGTCIIFFLSFLGSLYFMFEPPLEKWRHLWLAILSKRKKERPKKISSPSRSVPFQGGEEKPSLKLKERPSFPQLESVRTPTEKKEIPPPLFPLPSSLTPDLPLSTKSDFSSYTLPPSSLLTQVKKNDENQTQDLKRQAEILEETLLSFGIEAKVGDIQSGPTITLFEVHPAIGVKVQKIKALENDIALNMQAHSIRIIAPIPGKAAVGIEVPNLHPQEVSFREMLEIYQKKGKKFHIPLLLGKMVNGDDLWSDLTKMPHLIIAGATGSGKSVCINTIVMSIVMNSHPDEVKLLMIDPKKVELTSYSPLAHMITPVITEPEGAKKALQWLVKEMERRYEIFRSLGMRNILAFNTRKIDKSLEQALGLAIPEKLSYFVVIIDELADLMMISTADIETPIARIAQMARAVGIHLILATQRPSREVITGLIKANFPSRIAFKVASRVNSQIIIDETGAETLLGNGDMLFLPPGTSTLLRAQGAFIRDEDINRVTAHIAHQAPANYLISSFDNYPERGDKEEEEIDDTLYLQAKSIVLETGTASTTFLQRKLKIGYARAASLMDALEKNGIIGPAEGAKPRKIYYPESKDE